MSTHASPTSRLRIAVLFAVTAAILLPALATAQPTCIPPATGVFGNFTPPHWWDNVPPQSTYFQNLDDPRWVGAGVITYGDGASTQADFRALHGDGKTNLYLSWRVFLAPAAFANQNSLYVGLQQSGGAGDMVIHITLPTLAPSQAIAGAIDANVLNGDGTLGAAIPIPAWLSGTARVWVNDPTANSYGVEMRVPISAITIGGDTFKMWYELLAGTPGSPVFKFSFPRDPSGEVTPPSGFPALSHYPVPAVWNSFHLTTGPGDPSCLNPGVSLDIYQIGAHHPGAPPSTSDSAVLYLLQPPAPPPPLPVNTFFARPRNDSGSPIAAGALIGRFRVANWGSVPGDESGVPAGTLWADIPGGGSVPSSGPIPNATLADGTNEIHFNWTLAPADYAPYEAGTRTRDNCLLVDLTSTIGLTFSNNSIRRNMDFMKASKMTRSAEISVKGLTPIAPDGRDVYLYVEALNLPAKVTTGRAGTPATGNFNDGTGQNPTPAQLDEAAAAGTLTDAQMDKFVPTYRIHVFNDSGRTIATGAQTRPVLTPQGGFGYRVVHQGDLIGWVHKTVCEDCTLEELAPNFYRIKKIPNNGVVHVRTTIEAVEASSAQYRFFIDIGPNFPHGDFSNGVDGKFSVNAGIERLLASNNSIEGILGYHRFDTAFISNPHIWQLSANVKHYFGPGPLHGFLNGGIGAYRFDPGNTTKAGANVGGGLLWDVSPTWGLEAVYNFHWISTSGSSTEFSTFQGGVRFRF